MKRIAIIDGCWECMACRFCDKAGIEIPDDCPLRQIPEKKWEPDEVDSYDGGYVDGWNACLDAIGGSNGEC